MTTGSNPVLLPPTEAQSFIRKVQTRSQTKRDNPTVTVPPAPDDSAPDDSDDITIHSTDASLEIESAPPVTISPETHDVADLSPQSKPIQNLELWHQRMGHISPRTLQATQRCTTGIPKIPNHSDGKLQKLG